MKKRLLFLSSLLCPILFTFGCKRVPAPIESPFWESEGELTEPSFPDSVTPIPKTDDLPNTWDYSDVDISYVQPQRKLVALTFDDAPKNTLENILAVFADYNEQNPDCKATATVFCNGQYITQASRHTLEAAVAMGFELGNHTYSHYDLTTLDKETLISEIEDTDRLLYAIDRKPLHLLRAPFGKCNAFIQENVSTPIINWTIDTLDWQETSKEYIYSHILSNCYAGAIALMHDGYQNTVNALKRLLPDLKNLGYQVVSVSAMAKMHDCPLKNGSVYIRARPKSPSRVRVER